MKKELTVWCGITIKDVNGARKQMRTIVATYTKQKAIDILEITPLHFKNYWSETSNKMDIMTATENPETVFVTDYIIGKTYNVMVTKTGKH